MIFKINVTAVSEINQRLARALMLLLLIYSHIDRWISSLGPLQAQMIGVNYLFSCLQKVSYVFMLQHSQSISIQAKLKLMKMQLIHGLKPLIK